MNDLSNKPDGPIGWIWQMLRLLRDDPVVVIVPLLVITPLGALLAIVALFTFGDYLYSHGF